jgi:hypothetical protein
MERYLEQREKISRKLNRLIKRLNKAQQHEHTNSISLTSSSITNNSTNSDINTKSSAVFDSLTNSTKIDELKEQIDIMKSNIDYLNDQIAECQTNIIQLGDSKDGGDYLILENHINSINSLEEARFVLKKMLVLGLNKGIVAAQKEYLNNELENELEQMEKDYNVQQQLVQQIINSGLITNEFAQQILSNNAFEDFEHGQTSFFSTGHFSGNGNQDNFEIDEIILAPMMEDSSSESEDDADDDDMNGLMMEHHDFSSTSVNTNPNLVGNANINKTNVLTNATNFAHNNSNNKSNSHDKFLKSFENILVPLTITSTCTAVDSTNKTTMLNINLNNMNGSASLSPQNNPQSSSSSSSSSATQNTTSENIFKARQLIANGPQDLLYAAYSPATEMSTHQKSTSNTSNSDLNVEAFMEFMRPVIPAPVTAPHQATLMMNTENVSNLIQTSRVCSKSYTKIPAEVANEAQNQPQQKVKIEVVDAKSVAKTSNAVVNSSVSATTYAPPARIVTSLTPSMTRRARPHRSSKSDLAAHQNKAMESSTENLNDSSAFTSLPMSKSAIVTTTDKSSYARMTRSSMSRQNSK